MPGAQRHVWKISLKEEFQWILKKKSMELLHAFKKYKNQKKNQKPC